MLADTLIDNRHLPSGPLDLCDLPPFLLGSNRETGELWILPSAAGVFCFRETQSFICSTPHVETAISLQWAENRRELSSLTLRVHESYLRTSRPDKDQIKSHATEFYDGAMRDLVAVMLASLSSKPADRYTLVCMTRMLCARLCELLADNGQRVPRRFEDWQLALIEDVLKSANEDSASVSQVAGLCRLSVCHFSRLFRATFGMPLHRYLVRERIKRAMTRLAGSVDPIAQIALESGFADQSSFSRRFTALAGMPPALWRRRSSQIGTEAHAFPSASGVC